MKRENFELLLMDLYKKYSPSKGKDVSALLDKYNGQEFECVKYIFMTYNFPRSPSYDPKVGTDKHVRQLIDSYENGVRIAAEPEQPEQQEPAPQAPQQPTNVEVEYVLNFEEGLIEMSPEINEMTVGSRMLTVDKDGAPFALEIIDIFYDRFSFPGRCLKKITINRI